MRKQWVCFSAAVVAMFVALIGDSSAEDKAVERPNVVIIFCDDMGYGDVGCFGNPTIATPAIDRLAQQGQRWTSFYVAASVCTPSRAGLMTGRLPIRTGMCSDRRCVLFPDSALGLPQSELTIAEVMKQAGYTTACIGKWHLGHLPKFLPTSQGFDSYFGIPYSNDMDRLRDIPGGKTGREIFWDYDWKYWNVPILENEKEIERPADQFTITRRYTERACSLIEENRDRPFFIYLAHSMPHVPVFASEDFRGQSLRGRYGDVIEEIDWSVGQIVETLEKFDLDKKTLVVFTSDNGPWLIFNELGGSAGLLREGKGCTFEGGMRVPAIFYGPGLVKPATVRQMGSTLDLLPTCANLAGVKLPKDLVLDGNDLTPVLRGEGDSPRDVMYFYRGQRLFAIRKGPYKAHFKTQISYVPNPLLEHNPPLLYNVEVDPSEKYNVADKHPEVVKELTDLAEKFQDSFTPPPTQLDAKIK